MKAQEFYSKQKTELKKRIDPESENLTSTNKPGEEANCDQPAELSSIRTRFLKTNGEKNEISRSYKSKKDVKL